MNSSEKSRKIVFEGNFINFFKINWIDSKSVDRTWECVSRKNNTEAVVMVVWFNPSGRLLFIKQYRPPTKSYALEFPAGLIDKGESITDAALRELKEETGYIGKIVHISPSAYSSAGLSDEKVTMCIIEVDESIPENKNPIQKLDDGEDIKVYLVEQNNISEFINQQQKDGTVMTSRMIAYLLGQGLI